MSGKNIEEIILINLSITLKNLIEKEGAIKPVLLIINKIVFIFNIF